VKPLQFSEFVIKSSDDIFESGDCRSYPQRWVVVSETTPGWLELANNAFCLIGSAVYQCME
jgi:hypothetical protein